MDDGKQDFSQVKIFCTFLQTVGNHRVYEHIIRVSLFKFLYIYLSIYLFILLNPISISAGFILDIGLKKHQFIP